MEDQPTCGKGLAAHSALPGKMGELIAVLSENLEAHMTALDLKDENSKREYEAYQSLARAYRRIAADLRMAAREMAGYRDLPMGRHDPKVMSSPRLREAFERFVALEEQLLGLVQTGVERDRAMLAGD